MGSSASCFIALSPTGKPFYWTGETISGHVSLTVPTPLKVKFIDVNIIGQLSYITTYSNPTGVNTSTTVRKNFYVARHALVIPLTNGVSYDEDGYYLEPNTYKWPFSVPLAKSLPPSSTFVSNSVSRIDYFVEVNLGRSWLHRNIRSQVPIMITTRVRPPRNVVSVENEETTSQGLYIYGKILRNYLVVGEPYITLALDIKNPNQTTIKEIIVRLVQRRQLNNDFRKAIVFEQSLPGIIDFKNTHLHRTFRVPVLRSLSLFAPSSYYRDPETPYQPWATEYAVEVEAKTKLLSSNVILEFPIKVANSRR